MSDLLTQTRTLTVDRTAMLEALSAVSGAVPSRTPKEILKSVLLESVGGVAHLIATDLEIGIRYRLDSGVGLDADVRVVLPTEQVRKILADAEGDETIGIVLEGDPGEMPTHALVRGRKFRHRLPLPDPDKFPAVPDFGDDVTSYIAVEPAAMRKAIRRTIFACDVDSGRYALAGCLFEFPEDGRMALVATDGRRLSRQVVDVEREGDGFVDPTGSPTVVPVKALRLVLRTTDDEGYPVHLAPAPATAAGILIRTERSVIHSRLVEGRYPRYQDMLPTGHTTFVTVAAGPLLVGVNQAANATSETSRAIDFAFSGDTLTMQAETADVGEGEAEVDISTQGPDVGVSLDPRYVTDVLKALDPDTTIRITAKDAKLPVTITTDDGFEHCLMPITIE